MDGMVRVGEAFRDVAFVKILFSPVITTPENLTYGLIDVYWEGMLGVTTFSAT